MLKILGFAENGHCFQTQSDKNVVVAKFMDGSLTCHVSWDALLELLRRKVAEQEKAKREAEQASPTSIVKPKD